MTAHTQLYGLSTAIVHTPSDARSCGLEDDNYQVELRDSDGNTITFFIAPTELLTVAKLAVRTAAELMRLMADTSGELVHGQVNGILEDQSFV